MHGDCITSIFVTSMYVYLRLLLSEALGHKLGKKKLSIWDLHRLLLLLVNVAAKWREIGGGLHFPKHNLNAIGQKLVCIVGGPLQCLREILAQWLEPDKPPECDPATTCGLAIVLRCPSVKEGQLANIVERTFQPAGMYIVYLLTSVSYFMVYATTFVFRLPSWCR